MHSEDSLVGPVDSWHESCLPLGGEGCPEVAEFSIVEFAAALGPLDLAPADDPWPRPRRRQVVLHVHLGEAALLGAGGSDRLQEAAGPITAEQVRAWCGNADTRVTVQPVLDLAEHIHVDSYEASARLKNQVDLRNVVCVFPYCTRRAHRCDHDHRVAHVDDGPTCSCNVAPCCRGHHRAKTTGGWSYLTVEPGIYLWRSPLGYQVLRDHTGTLDVTPTPCDAAWPASSWATSATRTPVTTPTTPNPDCPAPHPGHPAEAVGALSSDERTLDASPAAVRRRLEGLTLGE